MYPHERSLVKRLAGKPFAIVGVNSDKDRDQLKATVKKEEITWRSFWNDGGVDGPIAVRWNIQAWPTLYVLDAKGFIRWKGVGADKESKIDETIETLLKEMAAAKDK
jgi:hypothetical protein